MIAHRDQRRDDGEPYIEHPRRVAKMVLYFGLRNNEDAIAAAWLHDVVEDTRFNIEQIEDLFNRRVAALVDSLTLHLPRYPEDFPQHLRRELKTLALKGKTFSMPAEAKIIKVADRYDNLKGGLKVWTPERVKAYAKQADELFRAMEQTTDSKNAYWHDLRDILKECGWHIVTPILKEASLATQDR